MVHLSRFPVDGDKFSKIYRLLFEVINSTEDKNDFLELIKDIFSPPEQLMVAKRIAIIYLLTKKVDHTTIAKYVKVSRSTVAKFSLLFFGKKTRLIKTIESLLKKEKISHFFENLFTDLFIQPGIKIGHYKRAWEHKKRLKEQRMIDA